jgi:hypothetical protein
MLSSPVMTNGNGLFSTDSSSPAIVSFAPGCVDKLVGASVKYWNVAPALPGAHNLTITPVTTLVEAYRRFACNNVPDGCKALADASLFDDVYALFGFPAQPGIVSYMSWDGIVMGTKFGVSIYVLNQRVAAVLTGASEVANALCDGFDTSGNAHVQLAAQSALVEMLLSKATAEERVAALSSPDDIAAVFERTLANLQTPEADLRTCKPLAPADRKALFATLAKVRVLLRAFSLVDFVPQAATTAELQLLS